MPEDWSYLGENIPYDSVVLNLSVERSDANVRIYRLIAITSSVFSPNIVLPQVEPTER